jgi:hypothetical protein
LQILNGLKGVRVAASDHLEGLVLLFDVCLKALVVPLHLSFL